MGDRRGAACLYVVCVRHAVAQGRGSEGEREKTVTVTAVEVESTAWRCGV